MSIIQSQIDGNMTVILITGAIGYIPILVTYGSDGFHRLSILFVGLLVGSVSTLWNVFSTSAMASALMATIVFGTGLFFLLTAYHGHQKINSLIQRVQEHGKVMING